MSLFEKMMKLLEEDGGRIQEINIINEARNVIEIDYGDHKERMTL